MIITTPTTWNELSNRQLKKTARLLFSGKSGGVFDLCLFKILVDLRWYRFGLKKKVKTVLKNILVTDLKQFYPQFYSPTPSLTKFIPKVRVGLTYYYSPRDRLSNISIEEFAAADDFFKGAMLYYEKEPKKAYEYMLLLMAVLYTDTKNPVRPSLKRASLEAKAEKLKRLDTSYVQACFLSFMGCKAHMTSLEVYASIFPKTKSKAKGGSIYDLILSLAGKIFGDYQNTCNTSMYTFLDYYSKEIKNQKKK